MTRSELTKKTPRDLPGAAPSEEEMAELLSACANKMGFEYKPSEKPTVEYTHEYIDSGFN